MNFKKLILFLIVFVSLSYYYYHHELENRSVVKKQAIAQKKVLHLETGQELDFLSIQNSHGSFSLSRQPDNTWMITEPITFPADYFKVQSIISTITIDAKVRDFGDESFDLEAIDLSDPVQRIGIGYAGIKKYLLLGDKTHIGQNHYARWEDSDSVFVVSHDFWNVLQKDLLSLRKRTLFDVDMNTLSAVRIAVPDYSVKLERVEDSGSMIWWITEPVHNRLRGEVFMPAMREISNLRVKEFFDEASLADPKYGLDDSSFAIAIEHGEAEQKMIIGNRTDEQKAYYAVYPGYDRVITIAADVIEDLKIAPEELVDTRILHITPNQVNTLAYRKGDRASVFMMQDQRWIAQNEEYRESSNLNKSISELLIALASSEYVEIISEENMIVSQINADAPLFAIELSTPTQTFDVRFYEVDDAFIVNVSNDPNYYVISAATYETINENLKTFL